MSTQLRTMRYVGFVLAAVLFLTFFGKIAQPVFAEPYCPPQDFNIPWTDGESWTFSGGPHPTNINWDDRWSGLDFSPNSAVMDNSYVVRAVASGTLRYKDLGSGYVYIEHDGNDWYSHYVHLVVSSILLNGTHVMVGDAIGIAGDTGALSEGVHLHLAFSCGGIDRQFQPERLERYPITLEGWKPFTYHLGDDIPKPFSDGYDDDYDGYLKLGNWIKNACIYNCQPITPISGSTHPAEDIAYHHELQAGCGVVYAGYRPDGPFSDIIRAAFDYIEGEATLGCSQNPVHTAGEIIGGIDYNLVLQDFVKDGVWNVIIHDEPSNATQAFVILDDFREAYFAVDHWYVNLGAPLNNEGDAATSPQGTTGHWQQFESGQIYSSHFGTFTTYGKVYNFYYHYKEGGTHSDLGFPTSKLRNINNNQLQNFEGGAVYCPEIGGCRKVDQPFCIPGGGGGGSVGSLLRKVNGLALLQFEPCDLDTTPPTLGATQLPATAVNVFVPKVVVNDAGGIRWVHMHIRPQGGNFEAIPMTLSNGMWKVSYDTNAYANGQVLEYLFWASDMTGNAVQISGLNSVTVQNDHVAPTLISINVPTSADASLPVSVSVTDPNDVAWVTMHIRPQGGNFVQVPLTKTGSNWTVTYDTSGFVNGQALEYLFWAADNVGNTAQLTGMDTTTVIHDVTPPTGEFVNPPTYVGFNLPIRANISDPSGVTWAKLYVTVNGVTTEHVMANPQNNLWEYNYPSGSWPLHTVIHYLIHAEDGRGNHTQVTGDQIATVEDRQIPAGHFVNVNERPTTELVVRFVFDPDLSGVANATLHYNVNDVGGPSVGMSSISTNEWEARINTSGYDHGTRINYLIHACDNAGNCGQITGLMSSMVVCAGIEPTTWCAKYYNNPSLTGTPSGVLAEAGTRIEYNYGMYSPYNGGVGLSVDNFSAKWSRRVTFAAGQYTFRSVSDEGVRVKIDGNTLFECWFSGGSRSRELTTYLTGEHVLTLEYFDAGGPANVSLSW